MMAVLKDPESTGRTMSFWYLTLLATVTLTIVYGLALAAIGVAVHYWNYESQTLISVVVGAATVIAALFLLQTMRFERQKWTMGWGALIFQEVFVLSYLLVAMYHMQDYLQRFLS